MKVTIHEDDPRSVILKIEGKVVEPMVPELERAWRSLAPALASRKLSVDLRGVTFIDSTGTQWLSEIHRQTGAEFLADTPYTKYYASEAKRGI